MTCTQGLITFVVIYIQVVRSGENCDERWKTSGLTLPVHSIPSILGFVRSYYGKKVVMLQEITAGCIAMK